MATDIVAEIGIAHGGDLGRAVALSEKACAAGADFVKFQTFYRFPHLAKYQFSYGKWGELFSYLGGLGMPWFSTPFDYASVAILEDCGMRVWKIPSNPAVIRDRFLLRTIANAKSNEHTVISNGISDDKDIARMLDLFRHVKVTLLYCVSKYPCAPEEYNLREIVRLRKKFKVNVGLSDHTTSISVPAEAARLGATMIEKHMKLAGSEDMPDDCVSLDPEGFKFMVETIRGGDR